MKVKILSFVVIALTFAGCTSTGGKSSGGGFSGFPSTGTTPMQSTSGEKLSKEPMTVTNANVAKILDELSADIKSNKSRSTATSTNLTSIDSYVGEFLYIPLKESENKFKVSSSPKSSVYELSKANTNLKFRSLYEGNFVVDVNSDSTERKITISNKIKYAFSENDLFNVIASNYQNKNFKTLKDSVQLHKLTFPNSSRTKDSSLLLLQVAGSNKDTRTVRNEYNYIQKNSSFTANDRKVVATALQNASVTDITIDKTLTAYSTSDLDTNKKVATLILSKAYAEKHEIQFLEKVFKDVPDKSISNYVGNWYVKNGNPTLGNQYLTGNLAGGSTAALATLTPGTTDPLKQIAEKNYATFKENFNNGEKNLRNGNHSKAKEYFQAALALNKNYSETGRLYFYIGQTNYNTNNFSGALANYKIAASNEKNADRQAEIYYNMGMASHKLGNTSDCKNYLTFVTQKYPSSQWSQKSNSYLAQLN
ncbi:tetratricopeptide repeat protein [Fusobacterium sp. PH5-44]|uniref:tetratricopeptide repeat protein n=1 Tax=unclassified Fusobacterium TaxID=2648384 RepID=UPI003D260A03